MSNPVVAEYLWLMDQAFVRPQGPLGEAQSVLGNLATVADEWWDAKPPGVERSIRNIVGHIGGAKYIYDDHTFRSRTLNWGHPEIFPAGFGSWSPSQMVVWMTEGQRRLMESIATLTDTDLDSLRTTQFGATLSTRDILRLMLEHDLYHAGEINHVRSLLAGRDRWAWEQGG